MHVDGQEKAEILERLLEIQEQVPDWDHVNICNYITRQ